MNITAVLVTFNHRKLLGECLDRLKSQNKKLYKIVVIDNASTDDTAQFMENFVSDDQIVYVKMANNSGGAGGFNEGIKTAMALDSDYLWLMDDDTMPTDGALEMLMTAAQNLDNEFGYLTSNVRWTNGDPCLMNVPKPVTVWNSRINGMDLVKVSQATFVSLLIPAKVIRTVGLPIKEFFIWNDDTEYTLRISESFPSYYVPQSIVIHKMAENNGVNLIKETNRIPRYYYSFRNRFYIAKKYGGKKKVMYYARFIVDFFRVIFKAKYKFKKLNVMFKGYFAGLFFNPKIEKVD